MVDFSKIRLILTSHKTSEWMTERIISSRYKIVKYRRTGQMLEQMSTGEIPHTQDDAQQ